MSHPDTAPSPAAPAPAAASGSAATARPPPAGKPSGPPPSCTGHGCTAPAPTTPAGKRRSAPNALRHGLKSAEAEEYRRVLAEVMRQVRSRRQAAEQARLRGKPHPGRPTSRPLT